VVRKSAKKSQSGFYAVLGLVAVLFAVFVFYQLNKAPASPVQTVANAGDLPEAKGYLLGNPDAPVKVIEFADYECPACGQFFTLTEPDVRSRLIQTGEVSYRFFDYPLEMHRNTWAASHAAACANEQGKFWEMHDQIFQGQDKWNGEATSRPKGVFKEYAKAIGLDVSKWESCVDEQKYLKDIQANRAEGERRFVQSTPTFIIGTKMIPGSISYDKFKAYVDSAKAEVPAANAPAPAGGVPATDSSKK
jgi:protein-disulfide isomerase